MANQKKFEAAIEIGGRVKSSLDNSVNKVSREFRSLEKAGVRAATRIDNKFTYLGSHIKGKLVGNIKSVTGALGRMGLATKALGGSALVFAGIGLSVKAAKKSIEEYEKSLGGLSTQQLETSLRNNPNIAKRGESEVRAQLEAVDSLSQEYQNLSAIKKSSLKEGFSELARYGFGAREMGQLSPAFTDYLAGTKGTKTTEDDAREFAQKVGRAIYSGELGRLQRQFSFTNEEAKLFKGWKSAEKRIALLTKGIEKLHKDNRQKLAESIPGKLALSDYKVAEMWAEAGKKLMPIKDEWHGFINDMMLSLRPAIDWNADVIRGSFDWIKEVTESLKSPEYAETWRDLGNTLRDINAALGPIAKSLATLASPKSTAGVVSNTARTINFFTGADSRKAEGKDYGPEIASDAGLSPNDAALAAIRRVRDGHGGALNALVEGPITAKTVEARTQYAARQAEGIGQSVQDSIAKGVMLGVQDSANILKEAMEKGLTGAAAKAYVDIVSMHYEGASRETVLKELDSKKRKDVEKALPSSGDDQPLPKSPPGTVSRHATGGIFRRAHLGMVAEAGPEAIIPLRKNKRSLGLLDEAAGAMGVEAPSRPQTIHRTFNPSITVKVNANSSHTEEIGQLVADAVLNALKSLEKEDYRESWA